MAKFERVAAKTSVVKKDEFSRVRVSVHALDETGHVITGNVIHHIHIQKGRVTDIAKLIEKVLFEE